MTTLADEIKGLMDIGHSLEQATELAIVTRRQHPAGQIVLM